MKHFFLVSSLMVAFALPANAQSRDSDGDVISVLPYAFSRDSDGNVISILYRDSNGNVVPVAYSVDEFFAEQHLESVVVTPEVLDGLTSDDSAAVPQKVSVNGTNYAVRTVGKRIVLTRLKEGVNPTTYTLD